MAEMQQYCTFYLDKYFFGVEVEKIQEILRFQAITPLPQAPHTVRGLINLRGQIVTAIDLRRLLEFPDRANDALPVNVILRTEDGNVSLLVDEIGDVQEVGEESFEGIPETLQGIGRELVRGVHKIKDRLLLILDAEKGLEHLDSVVRVHAQVQSQVATSDETALTETESTETDARIDQHTN